jgi:hypothetical protein
MICFCFINPAEYLAECWFCRQGGTAAAAVLSCKPAPCLNSLQVLTVASWRGSCTAAGSGNSSLLHSVVACLNVLCLHWLCHLAGTLAVVGGSSSSGPGAAGAGLQASSGGMSRKKLAVRASPSQPSLGKLATTLGAGATGAAGTNGVSAASSEVEPA